MLHREESREPLARLNPRLDAGNALVADTTRREDLPRRSAWLEHNTPESGRPSGFRNALPVGTREPSHSHAPV